MAVAAAASLLDRSCASFLLYRQLPFCKRYTRIYGQLTMTASFCPFSIFQITRARRRRRTRIRHRANKTVARSTRRMTEHGGQVVDPSTGRSINSSPWTGLKESHDLTPPHERGARATSSFRCIPAAHFWNALSTLSRKTAHKRDGREESTL